MKIFFIGGIALLIVGAGALAYFFVSSSQTPSEIQEMPKASGESEISATIPNPSLEVSDSSEKRNLVLSYQSHVIANVPDVTKSASQALCAVTVGVGTCMWGTETVTESAPLAEQIAKKLFTVTLAPEQNPLEFGLQYHIEVKDSGVLIPNYRMFVVHKDLLGRVNGIYEARITAETVPHGDARVFEWYLQEKHLDGTGKEVFDRLPEGTYEIAVADISTGRVSGLSKRFRIGKGSGEKSATVEYAANTPLINSYWDGRGVFFDGAGGEDTVNFVGTMDMYDIFKGLEFPERGYLNTLIFLQGGSVVITVVNVENVGFNDQTLKTTELMGMLKSNDGALYRTKKFAP